MKTKRLLTWVAALCCMAATMPNLQAQDGEMRWFKQYCGREGQASWISSNKVIDAQMDSAGNTYVFGMMGHGARLDGQYICPADSSRHSIDPGYFLAKVDTAGNVPWIRATRIGGSVFSQRSFLGMTVKNGLIYIGQNEDNHQCGGYAWYWFIDTVYLSYMPYLNRMPDSVICDFPFESRFCDYTRILIFDTSGKLLDHHRLDIANGDYEQQTDTYYGIRAKKIGSGLIDVDSRGNLYIFTNINTYDEWKPWNQENPLVFRLFNRDTLLEFSTGLEGRYTDHYNQINAATIIKIDSTWRHVDFIPLVDSASGWSMRPLYDSVWYEIHQRWHLVMGMPVEFIYNGLTIDEEDNIYLSGYMDADFMVRDNITGEDTMILLMDVTAPCKFFFDSVHYLIAEDLGMLESIPFVMKMDTSGNVLWVNQIYSDIAVRQWRSQNMIQNHTLDSNYLYTRLVPVPFRNINLFTDADHLDTLIMPSRNVHLMYLVYDKMTGRCVAQHLLDTITDCRQEGRNPVNVMRDLVTMEETVMIGENELREMHVFEIQYNKRTGTIKKTPSSRLPYLGTGNMIRHPHGFQFWYGTIGPDGGQMRPAGTDTVIYMQKDACYMMLYYDSTLDSRRPQRDTTIHDSTAVFRPQPNGTSFFTLTPNPTDGRVTVEVKSGKLKDKSGEATITLCDATGREVLKQKSSTLNSQLSTLNLESFPAGTYFVTVTIGGQTGTRKLVVK